MTRYSTVESRQKKPGCSSVEHVENWDAAAVGQSAEIRRRMGRREKG
jgi:hypothetical protein